MTIGDEVKTAMNNMIKTRVTVQEFLAMPDMEGIVELINGEVVVNTPKFDHQLASGSIYTFLKGLTSREQVCIAPMSVHLDDENFVQPDVFWVSGAESKCQLGDDGYWHGAPDLVVEVLSPSTRNQDKRVKFKLYEKQGVREYWIVEPKESYLEVWRLEEGRLIPIGVYNLGESFTSPLFADRKLEITALLQS